MRKRKKILCGIIMTAAALFITGCRESETVINEPLSEVTKAVLNCGTYFPEMVEVNEENFTYEYGLETKDFDEYSVYWAGSGGDADEICIIKTSDTNKVKKAVKERLESRRDSFEDYVKEEYDKLCSSDVKTRGDYVYWLCTEDNSKAESELLKHFSNENK